MNEQIKKHKKIIDLYLNIIKNIKNEASQKIYRDSVIIYLKELKKLDVKEFANYYDEIIDLKFPKDIIDVLFDGIDVTNNFEDDDIAINNENVSDLNKDKNSTSNEGEVPEEDKEVNSTETVGNDDEDLNKDKNSTSNEDGIPEEDKEVNPTETVGNDDDTEDLNEDINSPTGEGEIPEEEKKDNEPIKKGEFNSNGFLNIYTVDKNIGYEYMDYVYLFRNIFDNPTDELVERWVKNFIAFIDKYKEHFDKEKMIDSIELLRQLYDKEDKYKELVAKIIGKNIDLKYERDPRLEPTITVNPNPETRIFKDEEDPEAPEMEEVYKIMCIKEAKKHKRNKLMIKSLALLGLTTSAATLGIPQTIGAYIVYKVIKRKTLKHPKLINFLTKHGFNVDENGKLIDRDKNIITEENVEKEKYGFIKRSLLKLTGSKDKGTISKDYKKNKLASMLLNLKIVKKLNKDIPYKNDDNELEQENNDMRKGMGKC